ANIYDYTAFANWLNGEANKTFSQFLDDVYDWHAYWYYNDDPNQRLPAFTVKKSHLDSLYSHKLVPAQKAYETAVNDHKRAKEALDDYQGGKARLSLASSTERRDHSIWCRGSATIAIVVARHDAEPANELGTFTLSEDGRTLD